MIKEFEHFVNSDAKYMKLLAHLATYLFNIGYEFGGNQYNTEITKDGKYIFAIVIRDITDDNNLGERCICFKNSSDKRTTDNICSELVEHLKIIDGLEYHNYYDGTFNILGDIDNILKDVKVFFDVRKYNL